MSQNYFFISIFFIVNPAVCKGVKNVSNIFLLQFFFIVNPAVCKGLKNVSKTLHVPHHIRGIVLLSILGE